MAILRQPPLHTTWQRIHQCYSRSQEQQRFICSWTDMSAEEKKGAQSTQIGPAPFKYLHDEDQL